MGPFQFSQRKGLNVTPKRMYNTAKAILGCPILQVLKGGDFDGQRLH
jgi:hypothetical protein